MISPSTNANTIIIGGGFYGLRIALYLVEVIGVESVLILEKESTMMSRASYVNQARIHNGYHYPRSILTAYRSAVNFPNFVAEYGPAVVNDFDKYYSISSQLTKVNARQFLEFCKKIGVDAESVPTEIRALFNNNLTESIFKVKEFAFNSHRLRDLLLERISRHSNITIKNSIDVQAVEAIDGSLLKVITDRGIYQSEYVLNCAYSRINTLHRASGLPLVALKHEIAEMCLVKLPPKLRNFSVTMMDGPFFSLMPFPSRKLHTLSHVRYTPHESWLDDELTEEYKHDAHKYLSGVSRKSKYKQMYADVIRYIPALKDMEYVDSITEIKTVLVKSENDDSRPILFCSDFGVKNYVCIMGGKLDNIYDVFGELRSFYGKK